MKTQKSNIARNLAALRHLNKYSQEEVAERVGVSRQMAGRDALTVLVDGTDEAVTLTALFDNLGKGASGAAVQNMNLMLGLAETAGLKL